MRILFLASDFPNPVQPTRGTFNRALAEALSRGHDVRCINPIPWLDRLRRRGAAPAPKRDALAGGAAVWHPTYFYPLKIFRSGYHRWMIRSIRGAVTQATASWKPEVVLAYWAHPDGAAAASIAKFLSVPSAVIVGGSDVLLLTRHQRRRRAVVAALQQADAVITVNRHLQTKVAELGIRADKIHVWSQGVDGQVFCPGDKRAARANLGIGPDVFTFLCVARLVHVKGIDVLLQACRILADEAAAFRVFIVGDGPLRGELESQAAALALGQIVAFAGARQPAELGDWYRAADRTVLPSRSEGLPNVLRESLACGTHFIAFDVGGIREIAGDADVLVVPQEARPLAQAMLRCMTQPPPPPPPQQPDWNESAQALVQILTNLTPSGRPASQGAALAQA